MKKTLSIILALVLILSTLCIMPITANATETQYDLWVGETRITSLNADDVFGDGTVIFDAETNKLTLNNFNFEGAGYNHSNSFDTYFAGICYNYAYNDVSALTLELIGTNSIKETGVSSYTGSLQTNSYGMEIHAPMTIIGSGTLTAKGGAGDNSYGIYDDYGMTIPADSACAVDAIGGNGCSYSYGLYTYLDISGGSVHATGGDSNYSSYGFTGGIEMNGGSVVAEAGNTSGQYNTYNYGLLADINMYDGIISAYSGAADSTEYAYSYGLYSDNFSMSGGTISANCKNALTSSYALFAYNMNVSGGSINAVSQNTLAFIDYGIYTYNAEINGGYIFARSGSGTDKCLGICAANYLDIYGGEITAVSNGNTSNSYAVSSNNLYIDKKVIAYASENIDGTELVAFNKDNSKSYKYFQAEPVPITAYNLWIGGVQVTNDNADDLSVIDGTAGNASFDANTNTLTLNNFTFEGKGYDTSLGNHRYAAVYTKIPELTLNIIGTNSITETEGANHTDNENDESHGIYALYSSLNIVGSGKLTVASSKSAYNSCGISCNNGDINLSSFTGELKAYGGDCVQNTSELSSRSSGIVSQNLTLTGGAIYAEGGKAKRSTGLNAKAIDISNAKLTAVGSKPNAVGETSSYSCGLSASNGLTVTNSTVNASAGNTTSTKYGYSYAIYAEKTIDINNSTVTAIADDAQTSSIAIYNYANTNNNVYTQINITDSTVLAQTLSTNASQKIAAIFSAPNTLEDVTVTASVNSNGSNAVTYSADENDTYKWFKSKSVNNVEEPLHTHSLTKVTANEATAAKAGNKEYYVCNCGKWYWDAAGTQEITDHSSVIVLPPQDAALETETKTEQTIKKTNTDKKDVSGSVYNRLMLKASVKKQTITLKWKKISGAQGYIIYGAACGQNMKRLATIKSGKTVKKVFKKLQKGKYYKYMVVACKKTADGKNRVISKSKSVHCCTDGGKKGNPISISIKKTKLTVKKGKTLKLKPSIKIKKKVDTHIAKFRYESSNAKIAKVDKNGKVKGVKKGSATIYIYAQNGLSKTVKVTVK